MKTNRILHAAVIAAAACSQAGNTECGQIIDDSGFDLWCGDELCSWRVERGAIERVPTWHSGDPGVELVGDDVAIYQMTEVTSLDTNCIRFDLVADVEETATVELEIDVFGDGTADLTKPIPTTGWEPVSYRIAIEGPYQGVRFRLTKRGAGRAQLAQIEAATASDCAGEVIELGPRALGAWCAVDDDCDSGICSEVVGGFFPVLSCATCRWDGADCEAGETCGVAAPTSPYLDQYTACVPTASRSLGAQCILDYECATGTCCGGVCSTCCDGVVVCDEGETCDAPYVDTLAPPWQCDPAAGGADAGEPCLIDADCASGACDGDGDLTVCDLDGRDCESDATCPPVSDAQPGVCTTIGTAGGICQ